jgi:hypothetical protein
MKNTVKELNSIVDLFSMKIAGMAEYEFSAKPLPHKWSKKEVLGHLIDSAQNNLRRFICGQYEEKPPHITYHQDFWVTANGYQAMAKDDVIRMWVLINQRIANVLSSMPAEKYTLNCNTGKDKEQLRSLQWLAEDYVKHMKHHLNQIIAGSFDIVYN